MANKTKIILFAILALLLGIAAYLFYFNNPADSGVVQIGSPREIGSSQSEGSLGNYNCISKFNVKRNEKYGDKPKILELDFFQSFADGAFFGKIKNYKPEWNKGFAYFINQLMKEGKITTYLHLEADVCLYNQDTNNPENGASLDYYIEHKYCTNECLTGEYEMKVSLDEKGNFVGYRKTNGIY